MQTALDGVPLPTKATQQHLHHDVEQAISYTFMQSLFLQESQLERVTSACLTVQSFDQRIEDVAHAARSLEEKVGQATCGPLLNMRRQ